MSDVQRSVTSGESSNDEHVAYLRQRLLELEDAEAKCLLAEKSLVDSRRLLQAVIDSIHVSLSVLDADGIIILVNRAWNQFARENGEPDPRKTGVGINYLDTFRDLSDPDSLKNCSGIEAVLNGSLPEFSAEYPCDSLTEKRWFKLYVSPLRSKHGGAVIAHYDITDLKQIQNERETLIDELKHKNSQLEHQREQLNIELKWMEHLAGVGQPDVTAQMFGVEPLRLNTPDEFQLLVQEYGKVLVRALENRAYRQKTDISEPLRKIADKVGLLKGGPRDIVEIHNRALKDKIAGANSRKVQACFEEARLLLIKLMGYLAVFYRNRAVE
jgi:hypothetical protein